MCLTRRRCVALGAAGALGAWATALPVKAAASVWNEFQTAIVRDNDRAMVNLLLRGMDPNTLDEHGQPALVKALRLESWRVADALLMAPKVNVNAANRSGETPLMLACIKGQLPLVRRLLAQGADVNQPGWAPLHYVASADLPDSVAIARILLHDEHAYIDATSPNGSTPLLLAEGADAHVRNHQGLTAIDFARRSERAYLVELLQGHARNTRREPPSW